MRGSQCRQNEASPLIQPFICDFVSIECATHCRFVGHISDRVSIAVSGFHCEHHRVYSQQLWEESQDYKISFC